MITFPFSNSVIKFIEKNIDMDCNRQIFIKNQDNKLIFLLNSSCCPSLFDGNMKDIPKRINIRKARRNST